MPRASWAACEAWMGLAMKNEEDRLDRTPNGFKSRATEESCERLSALLECLGWDTDSYTRASLWGELD